MQVDVEVSERGISVQPVKQSRLELPYTEAELLNGITPEKAQAEDHVLSYVLARLLALMGADIFFT